MSYAAALSIFAFTVGCSLVRPKLGRWQINHAVAAIIGALMALLSGVVTPGLALNTLKILFFPIVTIISLMVITLVAQRAGLLQILANYIAMAGRGDGRRLFTYLFFSGALTGVFFTNDAAILLFTPLVLTLVERVHTEDWALANELPFYFAVLYVGNLVGALVICAKRT